MEVLFQCPVLLVLFSLSFAAVVLLQKRGSKSLHHPPGALGWPVIGEVINLAREGLQKFTSNRMKRYSTQVFKTCLMGEKMAFFCGPQGNKYLFSKDNKLLTTWIPMSIRKLIMFPEDYEQYREASNQVRRIAIDTFKPEYLKKCIPLMHSLARKHVEKDWSSNEPAKVFPLSRKYNFELACRLFLGIDDPSHVNILADSFLLLVKGMYSVPINLPGTAYRRGIEAGIRFRADLLKIIRDRRNNVKGNKESDLVSKMLLQNEDKNKQYFTEKEIVYNSMGLLIGSYETTGITITFTLKHLAELPHIYEKVFQEVTAIARTKGPDELLTWEDIEKMKYSWNVVRESMRVAPPAQGIFAEAATDLFFAGYTIPRGWKTYWIVHTTHQDPSYFPEPEKIDPTRFEGRGPIPYTFVPFGGGPRMCPGKEYARIVVLVYVYNVVTRFKLEKEAPNEKIAYDPTPKPMQGLPLRLNPHAL